MQALFLHRKEGKYVLFRSFSKYAFLNILGMIGLSCYILADTYFISARLGYNGGEFLTGRFFI